MKKQYGLSIVNPPFRQTTEDGIKMLHDLGLKTYPWVGEENPEKELKEIKRLLEQGADGVITNQPQEALQISSPRNLTKEEIQLLEDARRRGIQL